MANDATEHIFRRYEEQLSELRELLLSMGGFAEQRLRVAIEALTDRDADQAMTVVSGDEPLNVLHKRIDDHSGRFSPRSRSTRTSSGWATSR